MGVSCYCSYTQLKQRTSKVTLRCVRVTNVSRGKAISITYSECVSIALVTETVRLYRIFPHYHINGTERFSGGGIEHEMYIVILCTNFVSNILHCRKKWERHDQKIYISHHVMYRLFLWEFNGTGIFSTDFPEIFKCQISRKVDQWESSCSMQTDGRTDIWQSY